MKNTIRKIMTGNVANPNAYIYYADAGIDYLRACIGTGSRCTTSANVGVHYPTATLLDELRMEKEIEFGRPAPTKIIADGGIANFDDIQKCLALGAALVMSGSIFAKSWEACGEVGYLHPDNLNVMDGIPEKIYLEKIKGFEDVLIDLHNQEALRALFENVQSGNINNLAFELIGEVVVGEQWPISIKFNRIFTWAEIQQML